MALNAFMTIPGVKGSARQKGREGKITLVGFDHTIGAESDPTTGFPTKKVAPHVAVCMKEFDLSSPTLRQGLLDGKTYESATIEFWRMPPTGGPEENHLTMVLSGVKLASIRTVMLHNKPQDLSLIPEYEQVSFSYTGLRCLYKAADGNSDSGNILVDSFKDWNAALGKTITDAVKNSAKDMAAAVGDAVKGAAKDAAGGGGG